jgi:hypothetical protein
VIGGSVVFNEQIWPIRGMALEDGGLAVYAEPQRGEQRAERSDVVLLDQTGREVLHLADYPMPAFNATRWQDTTVRVFIKLVDPVLVEKRS